MERNALWFLTGQAGTGESLRHIPIHTMPFQIGRRPDLPLCLPRPTVSSLHAQIIERGHQLLLCDLGSTNGTYLNGQRVANEIQLRADDLVQIADVPFRLQLQPASNSSNTVQEDVCDQALALVQFDQLMTQRAVVPHFQTLVDLETEQNVGYEVLGRSRLVGLETPKAMFHAATQLNLEVELSRMLRWEGIQVSMALPELPHLFVNTHPAELAKPGLIESLEAVRSATPSQRLTLEVHEAAVTSPDMMRDLRAALCDLEMGLAYDDFGAGQTRMVELAEVPPEYLKFDMSLIRGIHTASPGRQQMLATLVRMAQDLGITPLAEGIETAEEAEACRQLGFEVAQGFLFGKPAPLHSAISAQARVTNRRLATIGS